jgi:hypothetical protein
MDRRLAKATRQSCFYIKKIQGILQNIKVKEEAYATSDGVVPTSGGALEEGVALNDVVTGRMRDTNSGNTSSPL